MLYEKRIYCVRKMGIFHTRYVGLDRNCRGEGTWEMQDFLDMRGLTE